MKTKDEIRDHIEFILDLLYDVKKDLNKAKNWGVFDILGGGFISSVTKHKRISSAENRLERLLNEIKLLEKELEEAHIPFDPNLGTTGFNKFMDIFMDNIFSDLVTQSAINDALYKVDDIESYLESLYDTI